MANKFLSGPHFRDLAADSQRVRPGLITFFPHCTTCYHPSSLTGLSQFSAIAACYITEQPCRITRHISHATDTFPLNFNDIVAVCDGLALA
jgi:hypothetical protein